MKPPRASRGGRGYLVSYDASLDPSSVIQHPRIRRVAFDSQTDSRELIGQWTCSGDGNFEWQEGLLHVAISDGSCLVVEGVEHCSEDVLVKLTQVVKWDRLETDFRQVEFKQVHPEFKIVLLHQANDLNTLNEDGLLKSVPHDFFSTGVCDWLGADPPSLRTMHAYPKLAGWPRFVLPPIKVENVIAATPSEYHRFFNDVWQDLYPKVNSLLSVLASGRGIIQLNEGSGVTVAGAVVRRMPTINDMLYYFTNVLKATCPNISHWPEKSNIPEQQRVELGSLAMGCMYGFLPVVVRKIIVDQVLFGFLGLAEITPQEEQLKNRLVYPAASFNNQSIHTIMAQTSMAPNKVQNAVACASIRAYENKRPVLLVGGAGGGKTQLIKTLAKLNKKELLVFNCHDQAEPGDLVGALMPVYVEAILADILKDLLTVESIAGMLSENEKMRYLACQAQGRKDQLLFHIKQLMCLLSPAELAPWARRLDSTRTLKSVKSQFQEGVLLKAIRYGHWLLLDEINLAPADVLTRLLPLMNGATSYLVFENGGESVPVHPDFKLFGTMNPPVTVDAKGTISTFSSSVVAQKRELANSLRSKFVEIYVDELYDIEDLIPIISRCLPLARNAELVAQAYAEVRDKVCDGSIVTESRQFSLRTLARILEYVESCIGESKDVLRLFVEATVLFSGSTLETSDRAILAILAQYFPRQTEDYSRHEEKVLTTAVFDLGSERFEDYLKKNLIPSYKVQNGSVVVDGDCVLPLGDSTTGGASDEIFFTPRSVKVTLRRLIRLIAGTKAPILLEGATSVGKTSMVEYVAKITKHEFVRINNHEQISLSEYLGAYVPDVTGVFAFQQGPLLKAVINGGWVVLDEFNLAPTEVIEGLNRLLDDQREIYIPELNQVYKAHPHFRVFATQNPTSYGGRKALTEAIQSRFVQLAVTEPDRTAICHILMGRCPQLSPTAAELMTQVYEKCKTQILDDSQVFEILVTIRDLLRWAKFTPQTGMELIASARIVIGERLRSSQARRDFLERILIPIVLKHKPSENLADLEYPVEAQDTYISELNLSLTPDMKRLLHLVQWAWRENEPLMLVGVTGSGKTAVVNAVAQYYSLINCGDKDRLGLISINCQQNTEVDDFIGCFKPNALMLKDFEEVHQLLENLATQVPDSPLLSQLSRQLENKLGEKSSQLDRSFLQELRTSLEAWHAEYSGVTFVDDDGAKRSPTANAHRIRADFESLMEVVRFKSRVFVWQDGPLIKAMLEGRPFLVDEINLADDAVIERLNSVLEGSRFLRVNDRLEPVVVAHPNFRIFATMNPGGDYGKRELSKAIRNRFLEVYVDHIEIGDSNSMLIIRQRLSKLLPADIPSWVNEVVASVSVAVLKFMSVICVNSISIRELVTLVESTCSILKEILSHNALTEVVVGEVLLHALCATFLDGFQIQHKLTNAVPEYHVPLYILANLVRKPESPQDHILLYAILELCKIPQQAEESVELATKLLSDFYPDGAGWLSPDTMVMKHDLFQIGPFRLQANLCLDDVNALTFESQSTLVNIGKLVRAMYSPQPVLLEGPPGVGKTALILYVAKLFNKKLYRFNLNEQTDMGELLGTFAPKGKNFEWSAGGLTQALRDGDWILLDEINLAPQPVLEGLNSLLDFRKSIYIPDINETVLPAPGFKIFAAQNSQDGGGGRKGLPQSFLNRFAKVSIHPLTTQDQLAILDQLRSRVSGEDLTNEEALQWSSLITNAVAALSKADFEHPLSRSWEWNARDLQRVIGIGKWLYDSIYRKGSQSEDVNSRALWRVTFDLAFESRLMTIRDRELYDSIVSQYLPWTPKIGCEFKHSKSFTDSQRHTVTALMAGLSSHMPILLYGPPRSGKMHLVKSVCATMNKPLHIFNLNPTADGSDLLGAFVKGEAGLKWSPSMLCKSVEEGGVLVLYGTEHAEPGVLDRLNALMEVGGNLSLSEAGVFETIQPSADFHLILVSTSDVPLNLSPAVRNRCLELYLPPSSACIADTPTLLQRDVLSHRYAEEVLRISKAVKDKVKTAWAGIISHFELTGDTLIASLIEESGEQLDLNCGSLVSAVRCMGSEPSALSFIGLNMSLISLTKAFLKLPVSAPARNMLLRECASMHTGVYHVPESCIKSSDLDKTVVFQRARNLVVSEAAFNYLWQFWVEAEDWPKPIVQAVNHIYTLAMTKCQTRKLFAGRFLELYEASKDEEESAMTLSAERDFTDLCIPIIGHIDSSIFTVGPSVDWSLLKSRFELQRIADSNSSSGMSFVNAVAATKLTLDERLVKFAKQLCISHLNTTLKAAFDQSYSSGDGSVVNAELARQVALLQGLSKEIRNAGHSANEVDTCLDNVRQSWLVYFALFHDLEDVWDSCFLEELQVDMTEAARIVRYAILFWRLTCKYQCAFTEGQRTHWSTWTEVAASDNVQRRLRDWLHVRLGQYRKTDVLDMKEYIKHIFQDEDACLQVLREWGICDEKQVAPSHTTYGLDPEIIRMRRQLEAMDIDLLDGDCTEGLAGFSFETAILDSLIRYNGLVRLQLDETDQDYQPTVIIPQRDSVSGICCHWSFIDPF